MCASSLSLFVTYSYNTYSNEVGYASPYGSYSTSVTSQQTMGYDISADYVDSTTTYEPRSTIIDPDFIGGHSKCIFSILVSLKNHLHKNTHPIT
jgi:nuclear receptor subfamily 1 group F protein 4